MRILSVFTAFLLLISMFLGTLPVKAESAQAILEQSMSETLDLWREGRYDQLFEHLAHLGKTSKEQFVKIGTRYVRLAVFRSWKTSKC